MNILASALKSIFLLLFVSAFAFSCKKEEKDDNNDQPLEPLPTLGTCNPVAISNNLTYDASTDRYTFQSDGGSIVLIDIENYSIKVGYSDYENFTYEFWGGNFDADTIINYVHEFLNGKHIKNKLGSNRSVLFSDGTKLTLVAEDFIIAVKNVVIHSGSICHYFNMECKILEYGGSNLSISQQIDALHPDGETSSFELTETGLIFFNHYNEAIHGQKVYQRIDLGEIFILQPTNVSDYFDDPRFAHT